MSTNPSNAVRTRARNGGRASVYEANAWAQSLSEGVLEGNGVIQNTVANMNVLVGGSATKPDVVIAKNPSGYKIALDLVDQVAVAITKPSSNSRIASVVAYTDSLSIASADTTTTGSPSSCGLIVVNGSSSSNPVPPSDSDIRSAITADGATGSQACYCVIANIRVSSSTTSITTSLITNNISNIDGARIRDSSVSTSAIKNSAITSDKIDWTIFESDFSTETNFDIGLSPTTKCSYTVEKTGKYLVIIDCCINALSTQHTSYLQIRKNGSSMYQRFQSSGVNDYANLKVSAVISCNAGDTISAALSDSYGIPASVNTIVGSSVIRVG